MRAVVQRVRQASVTVDGSQISTIGPGVLILLGVEEADSTDDRDWLAAKIVNMRIHEDDKGLMNRSLLDTSGEALVVSQFTLHASTRKGNRPSFIRAAKPDHSEPLYEQFCTGLEALLGKPIGRGKFGAMMDVALINDGPVTIIIDSKARQ
ncbi:MAG: D-aminoacyl-tRNA deacylase [Akkermansiaceae bacterium]|jgi:D-tyrosyl-tRNA(Tyr) deacylase|nr:D-aminoacyl-tRNA deacylase [Akkermansiaceae bacterium]